MDHQPTNHHHQVSDNFFYPTNNNNFSLRSEEGSSSSLSSGLSKLIECSNVAGSIVNNYNPDSFGSSQQSVRKVCYEQFVEKELNELTRDKQTDLSSNWSLQETVVDETEGDKSNYLLSLSPKEVSSSPLKLSAKLKQDKNNETERDVEAVIEAEETEQHDKTSDSASSNTGAINGIDDDDDDQRDPLAKLISSTIGDLMLDIAPAKN